MLKLYIIGTGETIEGDDENEKRKSNINNGYVCNFHAVI